MLELNSLQTKLTRTFNSAKKWRHATGPHGSQMFPKARAPRPYARYTSANPAWPPLGTAIRTAIGIRPGPSWGSLRCRLRAPPASHARSFASSLPTRYLLSDAPVHRPIYAFPVSRRWPAPPRVGPSSPRVPSRPPGVEELTPRRDTALDLPVDFIDPRRLFVHARLRRHSRRPYPLRR